MVVSHGLPISYQWFWRKDTKIFFCRIISASVRNFNRIISICFVIVVLVTILVFYTNIPMSAGWLIFFSEITKKIVTFCNCCKEDLDLILELHSWFIVVHVYCHVCGFLPLIPIDFLPKQYCVCLFIPCNSCGIWP